MMRWLFSDCFSRFELVGVVILTALFDLPLWGIFAALFALLVSNVAAQHIFLREPKQ